MQRSPGQVTAGGGEGASGEFFIPDLCATWSVFILVLLVELMVLVVTLASSTLPRFNWEMFAAGSLFVQWVVLLSAGLLCQLRRPLDRLNLVVVSVICLLVVLAVTAASSVAASWLFARTGSGVDQFWWIVRNLLVAAVVTGVMLRYFYLQQQLRLQEQLELQARLDSLRARIRPHFLFNTLNSIASLIMSRPEAAERAVEDLSELFRDSLQEGHRNTLVADELRLCELYLDIEKLRLGERLQVQWEVADEVRQEPMPSLLLQPLVENAVYHGVSRLPLGGTIHIRVSRERGSVRVAVENPVADQPARSEGHHMALANIEQRLHALYGASAHLQAARAGEIFRAEMHYPLEDSR